MLWLIQVLIKRYNNYLKKKGYKKRLMIIQTSEDNIKNFPKIFELKEQSND